MSILVLTGGTIVATFMETFQELHGNPNIIVSDKDPIFTADF
jgi:hypothetical protein